MKTSTFLATAVTTLCLVAGPAAAASGDFYDKAKVLNSYPIIETVDEVVESCEYQTVRVNPARSRNRNDIGNKIAGGILGGAAGSAVGKGSGRDAAAGIGAVLGAEFADGDGLTEGELIGGIFGGIAGNQLGKGSGKTVATAAGALIGSILGGNLQQQNRGGPRRAARYEKVRVCFDIYKPRKVIVGYEVDYMYQGRTFSTVLSHKPDRELEVSVSVIPLN